MSTKSYGQRKSVRLKLFALEDRITPTAGWTPPTPTDCLGLGIATDYNAFVFDNFDARYTETEGRLAVGGSANLQGYGVGVRLSNSGGQRDDLIVGGDLNYTYGQTFAGNIVYGGSANLTGIGSPNGNARRGIVIDFAAAETELTDRSNQFAALSTNGSAAKQWGSITLTGTDATRNVFNLSAADFQNCYGLSIKVPQGSTVIINVSGTDVTMQYFGIQLNGTQASKVLFNFSQAENLRINGIGIEGSVLAPKAKVNFDNGNIRGTLVAESFCGTGEIRYVPPEICTPPESPPEPPVCEQPPPECPPTPPECPPTPPECPPTPPEPPVCETPPACPPTPPECPPEPPVCEPPPPVCEEPPPAPPECPPAPPECPPVPPVCEPTPPVCELPPVCEPPPPAPPVCTPAPAAKDSLGGFVGWDTYSDYGNPTSLANVTVILTGRTASGTVNFTTKTGADGRYEFDNVPQGSYTVSIVVSNGYHEGESIVGNRGGDVMNATTIVNVTLGKDTKAKDYNFTLIPL